MPKASKTKTATARQDPIAKPAKETKASASADNEDAKPSRGRGRPKKEPKEPVDDASDTKSTAKDPNPSHLYTDDNPATTLHGTGFKDAATAKNTLALISARSLTYQFQTVNTMYHRAKHHPSMKKGDTAGNADMRAAIAVFEEWLETTYPTAKDGLREGGFKPMLSKGYVEKHLPALQSRNSEGVQFAETYTSLGRNKRLGNVLLDDGKPEGPDWEVKRYEALCKLVPEGMEWKPVDLWESGDKKAGLTKKHLDVVAWAWSPIQERSLP